MTRNFTPYSKDYIERCFTVWYASGRPSSIASILDKIPEDEHGRRPHKSNLLKWMREGGWEMRADVMDAKALEVVENDLIYQKAEMLRRQARVGFQLQQLGMVYLISGAFDSSASAVSAVIRGAELERSSRGIGELMVKMAGMTNDELQEEIIKQLTRATDAGQIIEGQIENLDEDEKGEQADEDK